MERNSPLPAATLTHQPHLATAVYRYKASGRLYRSSARVGSTSTDRCILYGTLESKMEISAKRAWWWRGYWRRS